MRYSPRRISNRRSRCSCGSTEPRTKCAVDLRNGRSNGGAARLVEPRRIGAQRPKDGDRLPRAYGFTEDLETGEINYRFTTAELKGPLQRAVTAQGGQWRTVAFGKL